MPNSPSKMKQIISVPSINKTIMYKNDCYLLSKSNTFKLFSEDIYVATMYLLPLRLPNGSFMQCSEEMLLAWVVVLSTFTSTQYTCNGCSEMNVISPSSSASSSLFVSVCVPSNIEHYEQSTLQQPKHALKWKNRLIFVMVTLNDLGYTANCIQLMSTF